MSGLTFGIALAVGTQRASLGRVLDEYEPVPRLAEDYGFKASGRERDTRASRALPPFGEG